LSAILCRTPSDIAALVGVVDEARVARARVEADARVIEYVLGSGEADEVALYAGIKPLVRQVLPPPEVAAARKRFLDLGLVVEEAVHRVASPSTDGRILFVGRDARRVQAAIACEAEPDHDKELGRLLGYPACCVDAYLRTPPPRRNVDVFARAMAASGGVFEPRLDVLDLAIFHYVPWLPCSFSCALSKRFADAVAHHIVKWHGQFLARTPHGIGEFHGQPSASPVVRSTCPPNCRHERFVEVIDRALGAHRLLVSEDVQVSIRGKFVSGVVEVDSVWPSARDRHPSAPSLDASAREATARLVALLEVRRSVAVNDGVVYVGCLPVLKSTDALLLPFGAPID
jgi:hypothetical protein